MENVKKKKEKKEETGEEKEKKGEEKREVYENRAYPRHRQGYPSRGCLYVSNYRPNDSGSALRRVSGRRRIVRRPCPSLTRQKKRFLTRM